MRFRGRVGAVVRWCGGAVGVCIYCMCESIDLYIGSWIIGIVAMLYSEGLECLCKLGRYRCGYC